MPLSLVLYAVVIASVALAGCAAAELGSAADKDLDKRLPSAAARLSATTSAVKCGQILQTAAAWEANTARLVFQSIVR